MGRILLVDDDPAARVGIARLLWAMGHDVVEARSGREALKLMDRIIFHLVVTDINMPDMDGIEVILRLQGGPRRLPVIAISGGGLLPRALLLDNARALGAATTLAKPIDLADLRQAVEESLRPPTARSSDTRRGNRETGLAGGRS